MSFLFGIFISGIVFHLLSKNKEEELENIYQRQIERIHRSAYKLNEPVSISLPEPVLSASTLYDVLSDIAHHDLLESFYLVSVKKQKATYQYLINEFLLTVTVDENSITFNATKESIIYFSFHYDLDMEEFTKRFLLSDILPQQDRGAFETIEDCMEEIVNYDWGEFDEDFEVSSDSSSIPTLHQALHPLETLKKEIVPLANEGNIFTSFMDVIAKIEKCSPKMEHLDTDKKHLFDTIIQKNLPSLFHDYIKLDETSRQNYESNVQNYESNVQNSLSVLEKKIDSFEQEVMSKNIHDLTVTMNLIEKRYQEK